jgi:hypothetical protein
MNFFQPVPSCEERVSKAFGLAENWWCFSLWEANSRKGGRLGTKRWTVLSGTSLFVAMVQSLCTAVLTISGIRVAIGLSALAAASGIYAPAKGFHQDAIRIPMLILATVGAIVNLAVVFWIWHLRSRPAAQWRRRELNPKERRSEKLQVALAILTLVLVGLEIWTHPMVHRTGPPPAPQVGTNAK